MKLVSKPPGEYQRITYMDVDKVGAAKPPAFFLDTGSSLADSGFCHFTARLAMSVMMFSSSPWEMSPGAERRRDQCRTRKNRRSAHRG